MSVPSSTPQPHTKWPVAIAIGAATSMLLAIVMLAFLWPGKTSETHNLPVSIAGPAASVTALETGMGAAGTIDFVAANDRADAVAQIQTRETYGAIILGSGTIVNVASEAGLRGNASGNAYTVSKHGVVGLTRSAAFMYGPQGLRNNAVAPGGVATGIAMSSNPSEAGSERLSPFQAQIPSIATAEQLAASITILLSDDSVNINGVVLPSDGGWSV